MANHYETLGVAETASQEEIKRAYRSLASKHHPDKGGDTAKFQEIQAAYAILEDSNKRSQYDAERRNPGGFRFNGHDMGNGVPPGMEDIFSQFGFHFGGRHPFNQPRRNKDLRINILLDLADTLEQQDKTVSVQTTNGQRFTVEVAIPRGVKNGTEIKYSGLGDNFFNTLPRGDLYVHIRILEHEKFAIQGNDLVTELPLNCLYAITGCETNIKGLDGKEFVLTIPRGCQNGTKLRIKGEGLWEFNQNIRGNLLISIGIFVPTDLDEDDIDAISDIIDN